MKIHLLGVIAAAISLIACAPSRVVKPLSTGEFAITAAAGGPFFDFGNSTIPMPLSSLAVAYGVKEHLTAYTGLHTTALIYGVVQTEFGVLYELRSAAADRFGFSVAPAMNAMVDTWQGHTRFYPSIDVNAYHPVTNRPDFYYFGLANWFELRQTRSGGESQSTHWIAALHAGYTLDSAPWQFTAEGKWIAPATDNEYMVVKYHGIDHYGAFGIYLAATRRF